MITSVFSKSNPVNYVVVIFAVLIFLIIKEIQLALVSDSFSFLSSLTKLLLLITSLFLANFISKRNTLTKDNAFVFLYFGFFLILIPQCLSDLRLIAANLFILMAFRRIFSLKSLTATKEKIFDASLWIFVASIFHFWSILFLVLVFVAIFIHLLSDFRSWFLPVVAFAAVAMLFSAFVTFTQQPLVDSLWQQMNIDLSFHYFNSKIESAILVLFAIFSIALFIFYLSGVSKKPTSAQSNVFKMVLIWIISATIFIISPQKTNALLLFLLFPTSIYAADFLENFSSNWFKEFVTWVFVLTAVVLFIFS